MVERKVGPGGEGHEPPERDAGYERRDVPLRPLVLFLGGLVVLSLLVLGAILGLLRLFEAAGVRDRAAVPLPQLRPGPGVPLLQLRELEDLQEYEAEQRRLLGSYGWIDARHGVVRIPIERAMELVAAEGLPVRAQPPVGEGEP